MPSPVVPRSASRSPDPASILRDSRKQAVTLATQTGVSRMHGVLTRAAADLNRRLVNAQGLRGPGEDSFTAAQLQTTLAQVRAVLGDVVQPGLKGVVLGTGDQVATAAATDAVGYMQAAERRFTGINQPLAIHEATVLDRAAKGTESSLLHRLEGSPTAGPGILRRYGAGVVEQFEGVLQQRFVAKVPWAETRDRLTAASPFLQGAPAHWAERIVRTECLVGETPVSGAVVRAAYRRWYEGTVAEFITEGGRRFTTTPNHPMLTTRGWVHAGLLNDGDDLVCYRGEQDARAPRDEHIQRAPATIAEIFDSLAAVGVHSRRRGTQPDFHGDGRDGDVDVACSHWALEVGRYAPLYEPLCEELLAPTYPSGSAFCGYCRRLLSIDKQSCFCFAPQLYPHFRQTIANDAMVGAELAREALRTFTSDVAIRDHLNRKMSIGGCDPTAGMERQPRGGERAHLSDLAKMFSQSVDVDVRADGGGVGARSCDVELDRVVHVRTREFRGHVYNLTTWDGYFCIAGAYTGNTMGAHNRASFEAMQEANAQLGDDMLKILCATFDDRTAADSYAVHGQIRRVSEPFDTWQGPVMTPPARPNDREVVVPHRMSWPLPANLKPRSPSDVAARWASEGRKGAHPPIPRYSTVDVDQIGKVQPAVGPSDANPGLREASPVGPTPLLERTHPSTLHAPLSMPMGVAEETPELLQARVATEVRQDAALGLRPRHMEPEGLRSLIWNHADDQNEIARAMTTDEVARVLGVQTTHAYLRLQAAASAGHVRQVGRTDWEVQPPGITATAQPVRQRRAPPVAPVVPPGWRAVLPHGNLIHNASGARFDANIGGDSYIAVPGVGIQNLGPNATVHAAEQHIARVTAQPIPTAPPAPTSKAVAAKWGERRPDGSFKHADTGAVFARPEEGGNWYISHPTEGMRKLPKDATLATASEMLDAVERLKKKIEPGVVGPPLAKLKDVDVPLTHDETVHHVEMRGYSYSGTHGGVEAFFGKPLTRNELDGLLGADLARIGKVSGTVYAGRDGFSFSTSVREDGHVASLDRTFTKARLDDGTRTIVAHHDLFKLDDKFQNSGLGKTIIKGQVDQYLKLGVGRIDVGSAWKGRYVWPKWGFHQVDPADLPRSLSLAKRILTTHQGFSPGYADKLLSQVDSIHGLAALQAGGLPVGKEVLLHRDYYGDKMTMQVKHGDTGFEILKKEIGIGGKAASSPGKRRIRAK